MPSSPLAPALAGIHAQREVARLSDAQRAEFQQNGFLIIKDALTPEEVSRYLDVVDRLDRETVINFGKSNANPTRRPGDALELRNAVAKARELLDLMVHPTTFPLLAQLMSGHLCLTTSHVFLRPPSPKEAGADFKQIGWHRDGPAYPYPQTNGIAPWLYTKIGYFLSDTTIPDCGALRVIPGSHRYTGPAPTLAGHWEPYGAIDVAIKPGSAVIFDNRVFHAVGPNFSAITRKNIYLGYCWRYLRPIDFTSQPAELLEGCSPIQRQLLGDAASALSFYLPDGADVPLVQWLQELREAP